MTVPTTQLDAAFRDHRSYLWGLCYRMTGSAADADDLVQDTFARAIERSPSLDRSLRPWLVRVAVNASKDLLRRRRRRAYVGPWLPSPVEPASYEIEDSGLSTAARYDLLESVSFAFLLALEALTPQQRAVLLLRDVFDYSVRDTAEALDISEPNVKTTLHRARRKMRDQYQRRCVPSDELAAKTRAALEAMVSKLIAQDIEGLADMLAADARALSDGGGEVPAAARLPVLGAAKIARFYAKLARVHGVPTRVDIRILNGLPALVLELSRDSIRPTERADIRCELDDSGAVAEVHTILAPSKLSAVRSIAR